MTTWTSLNLQESYSPIMEQLIFFHDHSMLIIIQITVLVSYLLLSLFINKNINRFLLSNQLIEIIWTILPALILMFIALPSLYLLYLTDEISNPSITFKSVGHQWYWSYEYPEFSQLEFDSYLVTDLLDDKFRLLDTDNRIVLPYNFKVRCLISSSDVIHSWTIPSLGVKVDGAPGRLNQTNFFINRPGLLFGQCSEICGANHSFMPIVIESVNLENFIYWVKNYYK